MLKSCASCGHIHDSKHICKQKQASITLRQKKFKHTNQDKFRNTQAWHHKREEIRIRDSQLCPVCIRNLYDTIQQYTYNNLEVHHAIPLEEDYSKRLENECLITLCPYHHQQAESGKIPRKIVLDIIKEQENNYNLNT